MSGPSTARTESLLDWSVAVRALTGETECGDSYIVAPFADGVLTAVVDGLGHGPEAAQAARAAISSLKANAGRPVLDLVQICHEALRRTRGAALSVASFQASGVMTWVGVGNVEGALFRIDRNAPQPRDTLMLRGGVVGYQLPPLRATPHRVHAGDMLVLFTDGIASTFYNQSPIGVTPEVAAEDIMQRHAKGSDDALVLVAAYLGDGA